MTFKQSEIEKIVDENIDPLDNIDNVEEFESPNPCWEIKIDRKKNKLFFLMNNDEKLSFKIAKIKKVIDQETIYELLRLFKENSTEEIKKILNGA